MDRLTPTQRLWRAKTRREIAGAKFSVIANDCWGGEVYRYLNRPYNTPFIGLFLFGPDFVRLIGDIERYMGVSRIGFGKSRFVNEPSYPVGHLDDDIEIHFLHYSSQREAAEKWLRRSERIDLYRLRIKATVGKDEFDDLVVDPLRSRPGTLILRETSYMRSRNDVVVRQYTNDGAAIFGHSLRSFDLTKWLLADRVVHKRRHHIR